MIFRFDLDVEADSAAEAAAELSRILLSTGADLLVEAGYLVAVEEDQDEAQIGAREQA